MTDTSGAFRFTDLPPGLQLVEVRRVGYAVVRDTIQLASDHENVRGYALSPQATQLDTVRATAEEHKYISPNLRGFEQRRTAGMGGSFIADSVLRQNDSKSLSSVLAGRVPGLSIAPGEGGSTIAVSSRKACRGTALRACGAPNCYVAIYLDGTLLYYPKMADLKLPNGKPVQPPPDLNRINVSDLGGVEFYAGAAAAPVDMHSSQDEGCGALWLWTREK